MSSCNFSQASIKGVRIGRLKTRDGHLLRKLRASGMTFREITKIAKCSTAAVSAEMRAVKMELKLKENLRKNELTLELEKNIQH